MDGRALGRGAEPLLRRISLEELGEARSRGRDTEAEETASRILADVLARGEGAVREWAERLGELKPGEPLIIGREGLEAALASLPEAERGILERTRDRVLSFAAAQRAALHDLDLPIPGGRAGHSFTPVARAGCYAPGGRFPLPSSAIMTACAAKAAGVASIWCAGPRPSHATLAAAALSGAEGFLAAGGAQGIAALAYGAGVPACDVVVGPGGRYVAAAKRLLAGVVGTEAPAGPSELLVIAGAGASPEIAAADLLAQAEHDVAAVPAIVVLADAGVDKASSQGRGLRFAEALEEVLARRLAELPEPNRTVAAAALGNGWMLLAHDEAEARAAAERFAPEHLELLVDSPKSWAASIKNAGAVFLGSGSAEVFGDYGAGPNHCLPTGGAARFAAGLSVLAFLRARTWIEMEDPALLSAEAAALARIEGLEAHARAAELRSSRPGVQHRRGLLS
jgi:phosphoribosyl-ATP pyrophosphohydrolase/phosphoribosyl-AMP cyclohydrolase/histidinol dehydrogenase